MSKNKFNLTLPPVEPVLPPVETVPPELELLNIVFDVSGQTMVA